MPYYSIDRYKVFLSHSRWQKINSSALAHKNPQFRISSMIAGQPAVREADELRYQHLTQLFREDPDTFCREWVEFDLKGKEAQDNIWDLLYDYCSLYRRGYLADVRSPVDALLSDYSGDSFTHPMGRVFELRVPVARRVASLFWLKPNSMITFEINTSQIHWAVGTLDDFQVLYNSCIIHFNRQLRVSFGAARSNSTTLG